MAALKKDDMFWNALMSHKVKKRGFFRRRPKLTNAPDLAHKYNISELDVRKVHSIFVAMDDDCSGTISSTEVASMLMGFGCDVSPKVVQAVMRTSDVNGDGEINFEEFLCAVTSKIKEALGQDQNCRNEVPEIRISEDSVVSVEDRDSQKADDKENEERSEKTEETETPHQEHQPREAESTVKSTTHVSVTPDAPKYETTQAQNHEDIMAIDEDDDVEDEKIVQVCQTI